MRFRLVNEYSYKQLGTNNKITILARNIVEAKKQAAEKLNCRPSSCFLLLPDGTVKVYTMVNGVTKHKYKIKADDIGSARRELASATDSDEKDWSLSSEELRSETSVTDIQYQTFNTSKLH